MDLRAYYKKLREVEGGLPGPYVVVVSLETTDGGKGGVMTEVARVMAAKQIVEGRARIATKDESGAFAAHHLEQRVAAEQAAEVSKMQFVVVPSRTNHKGHKE